MNNLPHVDLTTAVVILAVVLLLLTPLIGRQLGRLFEEVFDFIGGLLEEMAQLAKGAKDWAWRVGKLRVGRHVKPAEAAQEAALAAAPGAAPPAPAPVTGQPDTDGMGGYRGGYQGGYQGGYLGDPQGGDATGYPGPGAEAMTPIAAQAASAATAHEPAAWAVDAIVTEIVYLALIVSVSIADLVFSAERIALVLFKQPGVNFGPFNFLRDMGAGLAGVLFVGISLLAGMLVFDFLDVLPRGAQLFPTMKRELRKPMLIVSLVVLGLAAVSAAVLFVLGQLSLDNSAASVIVSYPLYEAILSVVLVLALIGVVALGGWGAIRGIGAIFTILLALFGAVAAIFEHVFQAVAKISRAFGQAGAGVLGTLYLVFHRDVARDDEQEPWEGSRKSRLTLVGVGQHSSDFTAQVAAEVSRMGGASHLLGVGVYAQDYRTFERATTHLRRNGVIDRGPRGPRDLSVKPTESHPQRVLADEVESLYSAADPTNQRSPTPRHIVWVVDVEEEGPEGNLLERTVDMLAEWQQRPRPPVPGLTATVVCLLPDELPDELRESGIFGRLAEMAAPARQAYQERSAQDGRSAQLARMSQPARPDQSTWSVHTARAAGRGEALTVTPAILMLRDVDSATGVVGSVTARALFTRSLAASLITPQQSGNHGLLKILNRARARGYPFVALSADAMGVVAAKPRAGFRGWLDRQRGIKTRAFVNSASGRTEDLSGELLQGRGVTSVRVAPDREAHAPVAVLCLAPLKANSHDAGDYRNEITNWFADPDHPVPLVDILTDSHIEGVDVSRERQRVRVHADRYCQVAYFYGVEDVETALGMPPAREAEPAPVTPWGPGVGGPPGAPGGPWSPNSPGGQWPLGGTGAGTQRGRPSQVLYGRPLGPVSWV